MMIGNRRSALLGDGSPALASWKASHYSGSSPLLDLSGHGHHARLGSSAGPDSNDALFLSDGTYLYVPGTLGNGAAVADSVPLSITADIDVRVAIAVDDWTPSVGKDLAFKYATASKSWYFDLAATGKFVFGWTANGSAFLTATSSAAPVVSDGALLLVRVTLDVDNGAAGHDVKFFTKTSTATAAHTDLVASTGWTQLGTTQTVAGTTSIFDSTADVAIGYTASTVSPPNYYVYAIALFASMDGSDQRLDIDFTDLSAYNATRTSLSAVTGQAVTINRATGGERAEVVGEPGLLVRVDDYTATADAVSLNFAANQDFTIGVRFRDHNVAPASPEVIIAKKAGLTSATAGYAIAVTGNVAKAYIADGATLVTADSPALSVSVDQVVIVRRSGDSLHVYCNGVWGVAVTGVAALDLSNAEELRDYRLSGAGTNYANVWGLARALYRRALTDIECAELETWLRAP